MHKDIKLENVMLRDTVTANSPIEEIHAMVVDVGLAELFGKQHGKTMRSHELAGSLPTMAPEVLNGDFSYKCDVWSLGCLLYAILNPNGTWIEDGGKQILYPYPFLPKATRADPYGAQSMLRAQKAGAPMKNLQSASPEAKHVVKRMLAFDERQRPRASECVKFPWFSKASHTSTVVPMQEQVWRLTADRQHRAWQRAAIMQAATQLPAARLSQLEATFKSMDRSNTGSIKQEDLKVILQELGVNAETAVDAARALMDTYDADRSGTIEWTEFVAAMLPACKELFSVALQMSFQRLDRNNDGMLERAEVRSLLDGGDLDGICPTATSGVDQMLDDLFPDDDSRISFTDFKDYFIDATRC